MNKDPRNSLPGSQWPGTRFWTTGLIAVFALILSIPSFAQSNRKLKTGSQPEYPELARKNNISGTARVEARIAPDGSVKEVKVLGGSPVLVQAVIDAVKKWKYEPAPVETSAILKFDFKPGN